MAQTYNVQINRFNSVDHDTLLPKNSLNGTADPTTSTKGFIGQFYANISTNPAKVWQCVGESGGVYSWKEIKEVDAFTKSETLTPEVAALYGLGVGAVPDEVLAKSAKMHTSSLLRDLNIMLNLSLGTSNVDAWADLLSDASRINAAASSGYQVSSGALSTRRIERLADENNTYLGYDNTYRKIGDSFYNPYATSELNITVKLFKQGAPTGNVGMEIWSVDGSYLPSSKLYTSSLVVNAANFTTTATGFVFEFSNMGLPVGTYAFVLTYSGTPSTANWIGASAGQRTGASFFKYNGSIWSLGTGLLLYSVVAFTKATVIWEPVTATETFVRMAVAAELALGTGTITFYVSHNGTTWTEITALSAAQAVSFAGTSVYLKAVITGNASLSSVAWGGY